MGTDSRKEPGNASWHFVACEGREIFLHSQGLRNQWSLQSPFWQLQLCPGAQDSCWLQASQEHTGAPIHSHNLGGCSPTQEDGDPAYSVEWEAWVCNCGLGSCSSNCGAPRTPVELPSQLGRGVTPTTYMEHAASNASNLKVEGGYLEQSLPSIFLKVGGHRYIK